LSIPKEAVTIARTSEVGAKGVAVAPTVERPLESKLEPSEAKEAKVPIIWLG